MNDVRTQLELSDIDKDEVIRYLGYGNSKPDENMMKLLDECEKQVLECARARFVYKVFDIDKEQEPDKIIVKNTNIKLTGNSIKKHLKDCDKAVFMAVTISEGIDRLIRIAKVKDIAQAVVIDSMASAAVEQACNRAEQVIKEEYPDMYQTFRFGLGYGDLSIELQADFLRVLNASKIIGLGVNSSSMLIPTKSVTAIIGLSEHEIKGQARGCQTCSMSKKCQFRRRGGHCNG